LSRVLGNAVDGKLLAGLILFGYFPMSYKYLKILGVKSKEKVNSPKINNQSPGNQWLTLNMTPKLVKENAIAPVINANFFI
jgi:hypothetical protein